MCVEGTTLPLVRGVEGPMGRWVVLGVMGRSAADVEVKDEERQRWEDG